VKQLRGIQFSVLLVVVAVAVMLFCRSTAVAGEESGDEKRSCIQSVDGFSYLSEDKTIAELRTASLNNAKQQALANAKTYIRSRTEVEDFILKSDEVLIAAEGTVTILEQKDNGIIDNSRYHVWIKAEVEYELGEPANPPTQKNMTVSKAAPETIPAASGDMPANVKLPSATAPLTVRLWSPKNNYKKGEKIEIFLRGNRDFYARIVDINDQGDIVQLLPNGYRTSSFFKGGTTYKIPDEEDRFDLTVSPPFGKDKIIVYASEVPLGQVPMQEIGGGLSAYGGNQQSLAISTRGISVTSKKVGPKAPLIAEFYETSHEISTSR
jgi:hypothetical protein